MSVDFSVRNIVLKGISVSDGIGIGKIMVYRTDFDDVTEYTIEKNKIIDEIDRYSAAVNEVNLIFQNNQKRVAREVGLDNAKIYETYHMILEDPFFQEEIPAAINSRQKNAEYIICSKLDLYEKHFESVEDEYLRERIYDIRGVSRRLIYHLLQHEFPDQSSSSNNIIVARELTPADSIHFHHKSLKGLVTEFGGRTSHAAILARSMEVPAIVGVKDLLKKVKNNATTIIDGTEGVLIINPDEEKLDFYKLKQERFSQKKQALIRGLEKPIHNLPNRKIRFLANINEPSEIQLAKKYKAQGVGLFRTELQFIAKEQFLTEDEQFSCYKELAQSFEDNEVVIRVLDLGGDKFLPFADTHKEPNPFLGWCSIRILLTEKELFRTQLRAILRASAFGKVKILIPMISSKEELIESKKVLNEVLLEMDNKKIKYDPEIQIGVMIEIPSAAIIIEDLIDEVDFVSIGTNDLIQYTLAVDRNNEKVASFYQPLNPAVIHLLKKVISVSNKNKKPVSVCGEMAGDPRYTQLLLSLGVNDFSMQPVSIPGVKNVVLNTDKKCLKSIEQKTNSFCSVNELGEFLDQKLSTINGVRNA
ncbi:MAG: phosphoenolpyruvate--protein phosphotransferase [Calditrichaeota bacterium]|nr:MAG: phosphoenolpyruvate--protein phosphotransferase [Calditrichota bacterium]MBL1205486.1 phosphoenolpyruvate--protein phosphotransferase [Calditrichota bacterium]NOG45314.1 phosphoenolpyruvate--protein phosphotransferase [Calditrichota bacterium]